MIVLIIVEHMCNHCRLAGPIAGGTVLTVSGHSFGEEYGHGGAWFKDNYEDVLGVQVCLNDGCTIVFACD